MVSQVSRTTDEAREETSTCAHHWVIEMANGPTSSGNCRRCGAQRAFYNTFDDVMLTSGNSWSNERKQQDH